MTQLFRTTAALSSHITYNMSSALECNETEQTANINAKTLLNDKTHNFGM